MLGHEGAVLAEDLVARIAAVADVEQPVLGEAHAVHRVGELLRGCCGGVVGRLLVVIRLLAVGAPVALVGPGLGIEHGDAAVAIAVGNVDLLGDGIDRDVGRLAEPVGGV